MLWAKKIKYLGRKGLGEEGAANKLTIPSDMVSISCDEDFSNITQFQKAFEHLSIFLNLSTTSVPQLREDFTVFPRLTLLKHGSVWNFH